MPAIPSLFAYHLNPSLKNNANLRIFPIHLTDWLHRSRHSNRPFLQIVLPTQQPGYRLHPKNLPSDRSHFFPASPPTASYVPVTRCPIPYTHRKQSDPVSRQTNALPVRTSQSPGSALNLRSKFSKKSISRLRSPRSHRNNSPA